MYKIRNFVLSVKKIPTRTWSRMIWWPCSTSTRAASVSLPICSAASWKPCTRATRCQEVSASGYRLPRTQTCKRTSTPRGYRVRSDMAISFPGWTGTSRSRRWRRTSTRGWTICWGPWSTRGPTLSGASGATVQRRPFTWTEAWPCVRYDPFRFSRRWT